MGPSPPLDGGCDGDVLHSDGWASPPRAPLQRRRRHGGRRRPCLRWPKSPTPTAGPRPSAPHLGRRRPGGRRRRLRVPNGRISTRRPASERHKVPNGRVSTLQTAGSEEGPLTPPGRESRSSWPSVDSEEDLSTRLSRSCRLGRRPRAGVAFKSAGHGRRACWAPREEREP